jgi:hypothetical protein
MNDLVALIYSKHANYYDPMAHVISMQNTLKQKETSPSIPIVEDGKVKVKPLSSLIPQQKTNEVIRKAIKGLVKGYTSNLI